jgi:exopolysaccharide biosynthesis polyprenyl glycosylphosphotransferase
LQAEIFKLQVARSHVDELGGTPILTISSGPPDDWQLLVKRILDIVGSAVSLLLLTPLFIAVAVLIKLDSPGPVFYTQVRVGLNKRRFTLLKFRTMTDGAEHAQALLEHLNEADGPVFKMKDDPRITRIGKYLRGYSIDELPQLFNVLRGDMSLVGPRPLPVRDIERINTESHKRRLSIKPGITCVWQANGRSNIGFDEWVRMDLEYIDHWSLWLDLKILLQTIPAVFKRAGAY